MAEVPKNWLVSSNRFAQPYSNPRLESINKWYPIGQDVFTSKNRQAAPIKISLHDASRSLQLQNLLLNFKVQVFKNGQPVSGNTVINSSIGLEGLIQSVRVCIGSKELQKIDNYPKYLKTVYKYLPKTQKTFLKSLSGYGVKNIFETSSVAGCSTHMPIGVHHPDNDSLFHVWALPNQTLDYYITLRDPALVFLNNTVDEVKFSETSIMVPTFQPPPEFQLAVQRSIAAGKELFYDYTRYSTQELACNGSTRQTYRIHMNGVRSLKAFDFSFVDEDLLANPALDKNEISSSKGLKEWFIQIGNLVTPNGTTGFLNGPANPETLLISQIKGNYLSAVGEMDLPSLSDYQNKDFSAGFSYQSIDESSSAALSFVNTDSIMEITTIHEAGQQPSTNCRMEFQYSENVTLSISTLVDVI